MRIPQAVADHEGSRAALRSGRKSIASFFSGPPLVKLRIRRNAEREIVGSAGLSGTGARPGDVEAVAVAGALMGVQRALVGYVRNKILAGRRGRKLVGDARSQAVRGFGRLEKGLTDYVRKR
ncbi:MAG: hypothetical protein ACREOY_03165 [Candidatus Dormibacteraceae bacterium]